MRRVEFLLLIGIVYWFSTGLGVDPERSVYFLLTIALLVLFWRGMRDYLRYASHSHLSGEKDGEKGRIMNDRKKQQFMFGDVLLRGLAVLLFSLKVVEIPIEWEVIFWGLVGIIVLVLHVIQRKTTLDEH